MERIVPTPVHGSSIVVVQYPLETFNILTEETLFCLFSVNLRDVDIQLLLVIFTFGAGRVRSVRVDKISQEVIICPFFLVHFEF